MYKQAPNDSRYAQRKSDDEKKKIMCCNIKNKEKEST